MDFGDAIRALKNEQCVAREGWNGKGMYLYLEDGFIIAPGDVDPRRYDPVVVMFTAQGTHQPGWLASQADMLAIDWKIVE